MKKFFLLLVSIALIVAVTSCKKEKCRYYNDIMTYYDQSEITWNNLYEQGSIDSTDLHNQMYKIQHEREDLRMVYKECVEN